MKKEIKVTEQAAGYINACRAVKKIHNFVNREMEAPEHDALLEDIALELRSLGAALIYMIGKETGGLEL